MANHFDILRDILLNKAMENKDIYFVYIDGYRCFFENHSFIELFPNRAIPAGISEANAISIASGLALRGKTVYVLGIAMYLTGRAYDQVRVDAAYNNANVKIIGALRGLKSGKAGYSHWAVEDFSLMKNLPNISVVSLGTQEETNKLIQYSLENNGTMYIGTDMWYNAFPYSSKVEFGKLSKLTDGNDFAIITHGGILNDAFKIIREYARKGIHGSLYSAHTLKPFDKETINILIKKNIPIVTLEESTVTGSLAQEISQIIAESGKKIKFLPIYIDESKFNFTGSREYLIERTIKLSEVKNKIRKYILNFKIPFIKKTVKYSNETNQILKKMFLLFGIIPLLKQANKSKDMHKKTKFSTYLLGFIRVQ